MRLSAKLYKADISRIMQDLGLTTGIPIKFVGEKEMERGGLLCFHRTADGELIPTQILIKRSCNNIPELLLHEFRHVWQIRTGVLRAHSDCMVWMGDICDPNMEYMKRPWEVDAYNYAADALHRLFAKNEDWETEDYLGYQVIWNQEWL